MKLKVLM